MVNYYEILNVRFDATQKEIRNAYVKQIKKFHPDLYPNKQEALKQTQLINEAYATLKDPIKRFEYDNKLKFEFNTESDNYDEYKYDHKDKSEPKEVPHFQCDICGRKDSSLRVTIFIYVVSLFYVSWKKGWGKILCNKCRIKYAILWNLEVWFLGWWSIYGFFFSIEAIFKNIKGGIQPEENNSSLLSILAYDFYLKNDYEEAYKAITNSLKYKFSKEAKDFQNYLANLIEKPKKVSITDRIFSANPLYFSVPSLLITLLATIFLISISIKKSTSVFLNYYSTQKYKTQTERKLNQNIPEVKVEFNEPELPFPPNGTVKYYTKKEAIAPLKIKTRYSDNYYLKFEDKYSKKTVIAIFIVGGKSAEIDVPLGTYYLKYAVGEKWYGEKYHFGPYTRYYKASDEFIFEIEGEQVLGYTLELFKQPGGNLREEIINVNEF